MDERARATGADEVEARANALMDGEPDEQSRKKQRAAWRKAISQS
jgi:hypothetical protein